MKENARRVMGKTLSEKIWDDHVVRSAEGEPDLLFIDLHLVHEVTSPQAFDGLRQAGRPVRRPDLTLATEDHNTPTLNIDQPIADPVSRTQVETLRKNAAEFGVRIHSLGDLDQGIVHIIGPQLGLTQPGLTVVCGDSHTSTHGAFGAIAFGIGTSEVEHVLATQTLPQARPKTMAVNVEGELPAGRDRQGHRAGADRQGRHRRRPGLHRGVPRVGHPGAVHGGPDDDLQHEHRVGGQGRPDRPGRDHVRLPPGPSARAARARTGTRRWRTGRPCRPTPTRSSTPRSTWTRAGLSPFVTWGTNPGQGVPLARPCPIPRPSPRRPTGRRPPRRWSTWPCSPVSGCATSPWTRCSSAPAPTAGSRTCGPRPP